jgi:hypothetical protein
MKTKQKEAKKEKVKVKLIKWKAEAKRDEEK